MRRLAWLTALALVMSCGGDPAPTDVENPAAVKRKKKKKKKKKTTEVADASEDTPKKKKSDDPEERRRQQEEEDAREAEARRERIRKREAEEAKAEEEEQAVESDEGGDSSEDEEAKAEEKRAKAEEKKRKKQEAAEEAKRKKEEAAEKKRIAAEEKKAAAEAKKAAAEEKKKKQKKKNREEVEEDSSDEDEVATNESDEEEETKKEEKKSSKKAQRKAKKKEPEKEPEEENDEQEVASADIDMEEDEDGGLPPPDPENESKELDLEGTPERDLDDETEVAPPTLAIDRRPLTQPKGKFDVHGGLRVAAITTTGAMGASSTATSEGLGLGATYGVSDKLQVSFDYTVGINPGSVKGPFALSAAFRVKESEKLDVALSGGFAVDFITTTDPMTMMTSNVTLKALQFGIWTRYHLGPKASVFTGLPALPNASGGLSGAAGLPPLPYHLSLGLGQGATIALEVPVGVGYQASPKLYAMAMTSLAHIDMKNSTGAFLFADYIPFTVGGFYAKDAKLDIGAVLSDDVKQGFGYLRFDIVARYYLK